MATPAEILIAARKAKGYTQGSLAKAMGISSRQIQRYEEGKFPEYKNENIDALDRLLGTTLSDIIYDKKVPYGTLGSRVDVVADPYKEIRRLEKEIEYYRNEVLLSLEEVNKNVTFGRAEIRGAIEYEAIKDSKGDEKKKKAIMEQINKLIGLNQPGVDK